MTKKQIAHDFYFSLDFEVSYHEPYIHELDEPHAPLVQAIIGTEEEYCVEIEGPKFLTAPLSDEQAAQLIAKDWNMPITEKMSNLLLDYLPGTR